MNETELLADEGLQLRDYFAAKALEVLLGTAVKNWDSSTSDLAKAAYKVADAMLEERKR